MSMMMVFILCSNVSHGKARIIWFNIVYPIVWVEFDRRGTRGSLTATVPNPHCKKAKLTYFASVDCLFIYYFNFGSHLVI